MHELAGDLTLPVFTLFQATPTSLDADSAGRQSPSYAKLVSPSPTSTSLATTTFARG